MFKDEYRQDAVRWLKRDANFFKHANNDPDGVTDFSPHLTELFIMMSLAGLEVLGLKPDPVKAAFGHWYLIQHPEVLTEKGLRQRAQLSQAGTLGEVENLSPRQFFQYYMQASAQLHHVR